MAPGLPEPLTKAQASSSVANFLNRAAGKRSTCARHSLLEQRRVTPAPPRRASPWVVPPGVGGRGQGQPPTPSTAQPWGLTSPVTTSGRRALSPGQEDPGLAAPPHGVEHAEPPAAAAHGGHSDSAHRAQEPGHRSLPGPGRGRHRAAIARTKLPAAARGDDVNPSGRLGGRGLESRALRVRRFPGCH